MTSPFGALEDSNTSRNSDIHSISSPERRTLLRMGAATGAATLLAPWLAGCATSATQNAAAAARPTEATRAKPGFKPVAVSRDDRITVPEGYMASVIAAWGEPVGMAGRMPAWKGDGSDSAFEQEAQMGMHHDAIEYLPLDGSKRGLLVMNHEYVDDGLLHKDGLKT